MVSPTCSGVEREPTVLAARVSNSRHGVMDTNDDGTTELVAEAGINPPAPTTTVTRAPIDAHFDLIRDFPMVLLLTEAARSTADVCLIGPPPFPINHSPWQLN